MTQEQALHVLANDFATLLVANIGIERWSKDDMERSAKALEVIGRPMSARALRKCWNEHNEGKCETCGALRPKIVS